jgi:hypothetical protein
MSNDARNDMFIVGPARSGTSWLQTMLAEHPDVASPPETELFSSYVVPMERTWARDRGRVRRAVRDRGRQLAYGLATALTDDEFTMLERDVYAAVRDRVVGAKPGANRMLEKTPDHVLFLDTIMRVVPGARFIFLVRNPRDTVRSLLDARDEPWGQWAPSSVAAATDLWQRNVRAGLPYLDHPNLLLVRYEDLRAGPAELERVSSFLGLGSPGEWMRTPADVSPAERTSVIVRGEAACTDVKPYATPAFSFHDRGVGRSLTSSQEAYVTGRCRDEMRAVGYAVDGGHLPLRIHAERARHAVWVRARALTRKLHR